MKRSIFRRGRRGEILIENVVFIVLNLAFLTILVLFLLKQGSGAIVLEKSYAKQTALLIDGAKPGMFMKINMKEGYDLAKENGIPFDEVVRIDKNFVNVRLTEDSGYSYSFFNDIKVEVLADRQKTGEFNGYYILSFSRGGVNEEK